MVPGPRGQSVRFRSGKVAPRSASAAYMARRSTNVWAHFPRPRRKGERAITTDLAGKRLRAKNYETQRPVLTNPTLQYQKRVAVGERPYKGPAGGYQSRTRTGQRAWKGDIAHYRVRGGQPPRHGERAFLGFLRGGGFQSATRPGPRAALKGRAPGIGARGIGSYQGNIKAGRRGFKDQGEEYSGNIKAGRKGFRDQGEQYSGNIKAGRKGFRDQGEEYSGNIRAGRKGFRDQGEEFSGNIRAGRKGFRDQGEEYSGNIRAGRKGFRDQGEEYSGNIRTPRRGFTDQGEAYTGNIKARRPNQGGGSRSGKLWNNNNTPILVRTPSGKSARIAGYQGNIRGARKGFTDQGEEFTGNIKARRPDKGGGSVSGKLWNNRETPIPSKAYANDVYKVTRFAGNLKAKRPDKGGGSVSGELWNNDERPIAPKLYSSQSMKVSRYSGNMKARRSGRDEEDRGSDFSGNMKVARSHYSRKPNAADGAMRGVKASSAAQKADIYARGARRDWDYVKNPSSDDEARKTREPGRAFVRSAGYHGNIKVQKFELFGKRDNLHPDARFVKLNRNNVPEEKDMLTNFKLWWARLFKKSETQPDHLKEKPRTPRYDKGESGLWYE